MHPGLAIASLLTLLPAAPAQTGRSDRALGADSPPSAIAASNLRFGDFDADGLQDVYVIDPLAEDRLLHNDGDALFTDVSARHGLAGVAGTRDALWFDFDGDAALDLFVASADGACRLFQNTGGGYFVDVTAGAGFEREGVVSGVTLVDFDADGSADLHLVTDRGDVLLRNRRDGRFERTVLPGGSPRALAGASAPPGAPASLTFVANCSPTIADQGGVTCLEASSTPGVIGRLYPLSTNLFVSGAGNVGIGTSAPGVKLAVLGTAQTLESVTGNHTGGTWSDLTNTSAGGDTWNLISTGSGNGEGPGKFLLRDADTNTVAMTLQPDGKVGIGSTGPREQLELRAANATLRIQNQNDLGGNLGGFAGNTFQTLQLGIVNSTANTVGAVPPNTKRSMLGMDTSGKVGSLTNAFGAPSFRNVLDSGAGDFSFSPVTGSVYSTSSSTMIVAPAVDVYVGLNVLSASNAVAQLAGQQLQTSGYGIGVFGRSDSPTGAGVSGYCPSTSGSCSGVWGYCASAAGYGLFSDGNLAATGVKSFVQPHPSDPSKEIRFVCLEGNESGTYFRGSAQLVGGLATIEVPEDFRLVSEADGLTVQLTPVGARAVLWVESQDLGRIVVRGDADARFHYFVNGVRRGYAGFETVRGNAAYVPAVRGVPYGTQYPPAVRELLVQNGTLNPDFTPNEATALREGWTLAEPGTAAAGLYGHGPERKEE